MKATPIIAFALLLLFAACKKESTPDSINHGKNRFTTTVDGDEREYYVHVPQSYDGKTAVPVVFMLHGTSGDGEKFYNISGWKEVGETENILTVFPSSWHYCIIDGGVQKNTTKWNSQPSEWAPCAGETLRDDIKFLKKIISELGSKYKIDSKRIYLDGFSNGGQMAAKCSIFMSDVLAAVIENAGSFYTDTTWTPLRRLPTAFQIGNKDYGPGVDGPEIPLSKIDTVLANTNYLHGRATKTHIQSFGLDPNYTLEGDTSTAMVATYPSLDGDPDVSYRFVYVKGLGHLFPNGSNHWMHAAELHWDWFKQYSLP
ncbi:MAG: hypothetical protein H6563_09620 [Lewinellaceae bacterium]|nr:hypothetical protein [Lewinellaceae bacterium]